VYREGCVLQHGSIRLRPDRELFEAVFGEKISPPALPVRLRASDGMESITQALAQAASEQFNVDFETQPLTDEEIARVSKVQPLKFEQLSY
jgi:lipoate---protein ligase